MKAICGLLAGMFVALAIPVGAQSLGELAKREQERRKTSPPATKTYTNEDLKKIYVPPGTDASKADGEKDPKAKPADGAKTGDAAKSGAAAKAGDDKPADAKPDAKGDEASWRGKMTAARDELRRNQMFRDALQNKINSLTADFTARDDPAQRAQIADERKKALDQLAQLNKDIDNNTKNIAQIEEDARKAGIPPGWIR